MQIFSLGLSFSACVAQLAKATQYARQNEDSDVLHYIDPLIGSQNGGNVFAGATLPYGMAKGMLLTLLVTTGY